MATTKRELLIALTVPRAAFVYGLALHRTSAKVPGPLLEYLGSGRPMEYQASDGTAVSCSLQPLYDRFREETGPAQFQSLLGTTLGRSLVRDTYEVIIAYCGGHDSAAYKAVENDAVMVFGRIVRNTFSHETGTRILFWPKRLMDTVAWRRFTITRADALAKKPLEFRPIDYYMKT